MTDLKSDCTCDGFYKGYPCMVDCASRKPGSVVGFSVSNGLCGANTEYGKCARKHGHEDTGHLAEIDLSLVPKLAKQFEVFSKAHAHFAARQLDRFLTLETQLKALPTYAKLKDALDEREAVHLVHDQEFEDALEKLDQSTKMSRESDRKYLISLITADRLKISELNGKLKNATQREVETKERLDAMSLKLKELDEAIIQGLGAIHHCQTSGRDAAFMCLDILKEQRQQERKKRKL